jgi:hypothetical protein
MTEYEDSTSDVSSNYDSDYLISDSEEEEDSITPNIYIKDDFESVITLSNSSDIILNKKIQQIKQTIDTLLSSSFTLEENIKIHSIYNFNLTCLQNRNRFLQEYVLILMFLEHIGICFSKNMLSLVFPKMLIIPKKRNFERIKSYITSKFVFTNFNQYLTTNHEKEDNTLIKKIEKYSSGVIFYIKNRLLLYKDEEFSKAEQTELCDILMKNKNNAFISDPKLLLIVEWLSGLVKNLLVYNMYNIYSKQPGIYYFNKKKSIDYHISFCLRIVICFLNNVETVNNDNKYITLFLLYSDKHGIIKQLLNNKMFQFILKEIIAKFKKEETLKVFKKQFIQHIKSSFNASIK